MREKMLSSEWWSGGAVERELLPADRILLPSRCAHKALVEVGHRQTVHGGRRWQIEQVRRTELSCNLWYLLVKRCAHPHHTERNTAARNAERDAAHGADARVAHCPRLASPFSNTKPPMLRRIRGCGSEP